MRIAISKALICLAFVLAIAIGSALPAYALYSPEDSHPLLGADYSWYRPTNAELDSAQVSFTARYLVPSWRGSGKALTRSEAAVLRAHGVTIVLNYEWDPGSARGGFPNGVRDARLAEQARIEVGAPTLPIYFSVDYDERNTAVVIEYLAGAASVIGKSRVGIYGGYYPVRAALNAGYPYAWQTYAWSNGQWDYRAQVWQTANGVLWHGQGDRSRALKVDFGGWGGVNNPAARNDPPPRATVPSVGGTYIVQRGDILSNIATRFGTTWPVLARINRLSNPNWIFVGQRLTLPAPTSSPAPSQRASYYTVRRGDTLSAIASRNGLSVGAILRLNPSIRNANLIFAGARLRLR